MVEFFEFGLGEEDGEGDVDDVDDDGCGGCREEGLARSGLERGKEPKGVTTAVVAVVGANKALTETILENSVDESATISGARNIGVPANFDKSESSINIGSR